MNKVLYAIALSLSFLGCNEPDTDMPVVPVLPPPQEVPFSLSTFRDNLGYLVLKGCGIGVWDKSTLIASDGNVIIVGEAFVGGETKLLLVKVTPSGEIIFFKVLDERYGRALSVHEDLSQNLYIVGSIYEEEWSRDRRLIVVKTDHAGEVLWQKTYGDLADNIIGYHVDKLQNGDLIIGGASDGDLVLLKINKLGEELMFRIYESATYDSPNGMTVLDDGRILVTSSHSEHLHLSWYSPSGSHLSTKRYGERINYGRSTIQLRSGELVTVGHFTYTSGGSNVVDAEAVLVVKTTVEGEVIWEKRIGDLSVYNDGQSIRENADGSFVLCGYSRIGSETNHFLMYLDAEGNLIHQKYYTDDQTTRGENINKLDDGTNILTGRYQGGTFMLNVDNYGM